jgi:chromosomal replication initiator protein
MIVIADIQRAVANRYRVPLASMTERDGIGARERPKVRARQAAMFLCYELGRDHNENSKFSLSNIGRYFGGRDHSTVFHACSVVEKRRRLDSIFFNELKELASHFSLPGA